MMNKVMRLIEAERACRTCHIKPFLSSDFHHSTARFTRYGTLEFNESGGAVVTFNYDQACALSRWLVEMLEDERADTQDR